jgi:cold shock CspA family protein
MQEQKEKIGIIRSWTESRGFGIIRIGGPESLEKYFLHISQIRSGTGLPKPGMIVRFEIGDLPVKEGQLPPAVRAHIEVSTKLDGGAK